MKQSRFLTMLVLVFGLSSAASAQGQQDHQEHHPGGTAEQAQPTPPQMPGPGQAQGQMPMGQMMQDMPEHCRGMMQNMQSCMGTMQQMMRGRMGQGDAMPGQMDQGGAMPGKSASMSEAATAYADAAGRMHLPMMQGLQASDPDVAYVRGMIAHHQGAIEMAKVRLRYGKDEQTKMWANNVIRDQQREIEEMESWLKKNAG
jgi:uncharacterized protein (DUF305 family)